jgi:hypothetical protein
MKLSEVTYRLLVCGESLHMWLAMAKRRWVFPRPTPP